jgi:phosphodiesterase/alkaline phosphatase D-like protein
MAALSVHFDHGVSSGDPYRDSLILWTRITPGDDVSGPVAVSWEVATTPDFADASIVDTGIFSTSVDRDWTVKVEATGLKADTTYYYRFHTDSAESIVGQSKTLPQDKEAVRLAVFSCANFTASEQFDAYGRAAAIHAVNPYDALLHLGDYLYEYGPGGYESAEAASAARGFEPNGELITLSDYRQRYAQYHSDANLQALRSVAPLIAIWDDHETANDSWVGGAENHQIDREGDWATRRDAALKAYYEWMPIREPGQPQASDNFGIGAPLSQGYRSFDFGDVLSLHMLETRLTARDEQLAYPDATAVSSRVQAILGNPTELEAYAARLGVAAPVTSDSSASFTAQLASLVGQELVAATVQQAWGDAGRDLLGDQQMAWLQERLASSDASWQVLGQQVLMQSMTVPAELLLNAGNPALIDRYAAPLQKLATGTTFNNLSPTEQSLFAEPGKLPYNLDAWDGYGVERETILQSALSQGKRLISLAGDTHNAWAGALDSMVPGTSPAGSIAGVEFATPGVTSPGLEKYLPGADAYIRSKYPAVDGLDGLFTGYVKGLAYADLNRRGFLDLSLTKETATANFILLDGMNALTNQPQWVTESVVADANLSLSVLPTVTPRIIWSADWEELDLVMGLAVESSGNSILLDPATYATLPRDGIQLPDVSVQGSDQGERIFTGAGSFVDGAGGSDELFNTESQGENLLLGGLGSDRFFLQRVNDQVIGGSLLDDAVAFGLSPHTALTDGERDIFSIDGSGTPIGNDLQILDYEPGLDGLLLDGQPLLDEWPSVRQQLQALGVTINAAPQKKDGPIRIPIQLGQEGEQDLSPFINDADGDTLQLLKRKGPSWFNAEGTTLRWTPPADLNAETLASLDLVLGISDGQAVTEVVPVLSLAPPTPALPQLSIEAQDQEKQEGNSGSTPYLFQVNREGDTSGESRSRWSLRGSGNHPADGSDWLGDRLPSGEVFFSASQTKQTITINIAADSNLEPDEGFTVSLEAPMDATLKEGGASASGVIRNDDTAPTPPPPTPLPGTPPTLAIVSNATEVVEGNSNSVLLSFTISRSGDVGGISELDWQVRGDGPNPADANDFSGGLPSGNLRFLPGVTTQTLSVMVAGDRLQESDESFTVAISGARGATISVASASSTIRNDDRIGGGGRNRFIGTDLPEFFDGRGGRDKLTGGAGADTFGFRFRDSDIRKPDHITDFRFGEDKIDLFRSNGQEMSAPKRFTRAADNSQAKNLSDLAKAVFADANGKEPGKQRLGANAAVLVRATAAGISGTYLLVNNGDQSLNSNQDLMVELSGFNGRLPRLGNQAVDSVFA